MVVTDNNSAIFCTLVPVPCCFLRWGRCCRWCRSSSIFSFFGSDDNVRWYHLFQIHTRPGPGIAQSDAGAQTRVEFVISGTAFCQDQSSKASHNNPRRRLHQHILKALTNTSVDALIGWYGFVVFVHLISTAAAHGWKVRILLWVLIRPNPER